MGLFVIIGSVITGLVTGFSFFFRWLKRTFLKDIVASNKKQFETLTGEVKQVVTEAKITSQNLKEVQRVYYDSLDKGQKAIKETVDTIKGKVETVAEKYTEHEIWSKGYTEKTTTTMDQHDKRLDNLEKIGQKVLDFFMRLEKK